MECRVIITTPLDKLAQPTAKFWVMQKLLIPHNVKLVKNEQDGNKLIWHLSLTFSQYMKLAKNISKFRAVAALVIGDKTIIRKAIKRFGKVSDAEFNVVAELINNGTDIVIDKGDVIDKSKMS